MKLLWPILVIALLLNPAEPRSGDHKVSDPILKNELAAYLADQAGCEPDQIYFSSIDQYDFLGKGYEQAVVVASTCMTGTAGPDVHAVYTRDERGELKELEIEQVKLPHRVLFGNPNSYFEVEAGMLVEKYADTSDRDWPLVIKYRWDAARSKFAAVSMVAAKPYPTSYDCAKAETNSDETASAICYVQPLADLDLELAKTYKAYLAGLPRTERDAGIREQRDWLAERNRKCTIYKWWVECLTESYSSRISELKTRIEKQKEAEPRIKP